MHVPRIVHVTVCRMKLASFPPTRLLCNAWPRAPASLSYLQRTMKQAARIINAILAVCIGPLLLAPTVPATTSSAFADAENSFYDYSGDEFELVKNFNFDQCDYNTWMCCWDGRDGLSVTDNTVRRDKVPPVFNAVVSCYACSVDFVAFNEPQAR